MIIKAPSEMRKQSAFWRSEGRRIVLVPTMGFLHAGHVSLLDEGRKRGDILVLSIFVNPTQFGPKEDLSRYPRDLDGDLAKAKNAGVDCVFLPEAEDMYPPGYQTYVDVRELSQGLCGDKRPGHFTGVATVVLKLFNLVAPHLALFGMKDYQQLQLLRRMARDLELDLEVVGLPIVREADGLAMSSRNAYLNEDERLRALALSRALQVGKVAFDAGQRQAAKIIDAARVSLHMTDGVRLDYLELRDAETLRLIDDKVTRPAVMAIAAFVGKTRLIDNQLLTP